MEEVTHIYSPQKLNTTRVIIFGKEKNKRFSVQFDNKYIPEIFKKNGIKIPKPLLK